MKKIILIFSFFILCGQNLFAQVLDVSQPSFFTRTAFSAETILGEHQKVSELSTQEVRDRIKFLMKLEGGDPLERALFFSKITSVRSRQHNCGESFLPKLVNAQIYEPLTETEKTALIETFNNRLKNSTKRQREVLANLYATYVFWRHNDIVIFPGLSQETQDELKIMTFLRDYFVDDNLQISGTDDDWLKTVFAETSSLRVHLLAKAVLILAGTPLSEIEKLEANSQKFVPVEAGSLEELYSLWLDALVEAKNGNAISENLRSRIAKILEARPAFFVFPIIVESFANDEKWNDAAYFQYLQLRELPYWPHSKFEKLWQNFYNLAGYFEKDDDCRNFLICAGFWEASRDHRKNNPLLKYRINARAKKILDRALESGKITKEESLHSLLLGGAMAKHGFFENMDFDNRYFKNSKAELILRYTLENLLISLEAFEKMKEKNKEYEIETAE